MTRTTNDKNKDLNDYHIQLTFVVFIIWILTPLHCRKTCVVLKRHFSTNIKYLALCTYIVPSKNWNNENWRAFHFPASCQIMYLPTIIHFRAFWVARDYNKFGCLSNRTALRLGIHKPLSVRSSSPQLLLLRIEAATIHK